MQSNNELLVLETAKKSGGSNFVSEIKHVENYPAFKKLVHIYQHGLQGFMDKNSSRAVE